MRTLLFFLIILAGLSARSIILVAQPLTVEQIDSIAEKSLASFPQAGIAVAIVKDGNVVMSKGYGLASVETGATVDENTLFAIASLTKSFTATAIAILVDEKKISWNDKVIKHLPEFRMYDPYITENFTVMDLLTHRSGLGLGAGDLMIFPDGSDFTVSDVLNSFQYQKPVSQFRTKYDYDNLMYIVAGEVIKRVSGMEYTAFIRTRIMEPLGMDRSAPSAGTIVNKGNLALPHNTEGGEIKQINSYSHELTNAAGGICASINDLSKWLLVQLNNGRYGDSLENELFSAAVQQEMWRPYTNIDFRVIPGRRYNKHFTGYGPGWEISDYCGYITLSHGGALPGMLSQITMIPELDLGVVVLTNSQPGGLSYFTLNWAIIDSYLGVEKRDWNAMAEQLLQSTQHDVDSVYTAVWRTVDENRMEKRDFSCLTGVYEDAWFGKMEVSESNGELWIKSLRSPKLTGQMFFYKATTYVIRWNYTDMPCDAFATFNMDTEGTAVSIKLKGISPNIDFSFDFQDLHLTRILNTW